MRTESRSIVLSSKESTFSEDLYPPIKLDNNGHHEIALVGLDMYHSIPNIDNKNNKFVYQYKNEEYTIIIPIGCYEIDSINEYIQKKCVENNHINLFEIKANTNTLKCLIELKDSEVKIHFNKSRSLRSLLGFRNETLENIGEYESNNIVSILSVNAILVHCNIIEGSYLNGSQKPILYTFFPNVPPGYKIVENPHSAIYLPVSFSTINRIQISLTDRDGEELNIREEKITIRLHLRSTYN